MATQRKDAPARDVDPEPIVEEVTAMPTGTRHVEKRVIVSSAGSVTLPSGASYVLEPGKVMKTTSEDSSWLVKNGYAVEED